MFFYLKRFCRSGSIYNQRQKVEVAKKKFTVSLTKVDGKLGFVLSNHTITAVKGEPAVSDGRIRPGDKLLSCNGVDMAGFSEAQVIEFLRQIPDITILTFYRE